MTRDQKTVGIGAASGVVAMIISIAGIYELWPINPGLADISRRLAFALQANAFAALPLLIGVLTVGKLSGDWFIVMMILVYFTWGSMFALFPAIIGDYYGPKCATSNYGFLYTAKGVASIGGGGIAAWLFIKFGNWSAAFYSTAALTLLSALLILVLRFMPLPRLSRRAEPALVTAKAG